MEEKLTLEQILNASNNAVILLDTSGSIFFANVQVRKFIGLNPAKIIGANIIDVLPNAGWPVMQSLQTGEAQLGCLIPGKQGNLVLSIGLIRGNQKIKGAVCSFQRIEQMELSAQEFESYKNLNRQLNAIFHSSSDGIWVCDGQGKVIDINEASEKLNSIKAADVVGKNVRDFVDSGLFDRSVTLEVLETRRQVSVIQNIKRTGKLLLVTGTPVFDEAGNIFMVVVNELDMTQLNEIREQLEESRMMTEKYREELAELSVLELKKQEIIAENAGMRQVLAVALKLAHIDATNILILGESGTGKGLLAKFIHKNSKRSTKPFIQINCAALPESLLEAELFGYEKGAFTGAREQGKAGLFELAHEGALFLDEIGDLPLTVQAKLLKYLDDQEIMRLGSLKPRKIDCIVIAATNQDLEGLTRAKFFRQDLFYRLNTFTIRIPPLRERVEDIFELANYFLRKYNRSYQLKRRISPVALEALQSYLFSGNVRELKSLLKKAVIMSDQELLDDFIIASLREGSKVIGRRLHKKQSHKSLSEGIDRLEREILEQALRKYKSTRQLARHLGISQPTVVRKLKKYGLSSRG
jgi:TyrR family helix-turn-helix protein/PAS domain S-box-containing protein